jgi:branched-chain amino acid transport system ATP-binding protein
VIIDALVTMRRDEGITLRIVEHNMRAVTELCEKVYVLAAGRVIAEGAPAEI